MKNLAARITGFVCFALFATWAFSAEAQSISRSIATALKAQDTQTVGRQASPFSLVLNKFYAENGFRPLWVTQGKLNSRAKALGNVLANAETEGLDPAAYSFSFAPGANPEFVEIAVSTAFLRYVTDLQTGRLSPRLIDPDLFVFERSLDHMGVLSGLVQASDIPTFLAGLAPQSSAYIALRKKLAEFRSIARRGGWKIVPDGPVLKPGMTDHRIEVLAHRLSLQGSLGIKEGASNVYDLALVSKVQEFQARVGLAADGVIGKQTLASLNVPIEKRILQIILNMERARWMPDDLGEDHILVNVAGFDLKAVSRGETVLSMRVVIGKPYRRTPVFSEKLSHLEFNPFWTVPPRIALLDLVPKLKQDKEYFTKQKITVYDGWGREARPVDITTIKWSKYTVRNFPYRFRQEPGPFNALGRVKFMFPNKFSVYLHDTTEKALFGNTSRAFSSGCVRVEKPIELATFVLRDQPDWSREQIEAALEKKDTRAVKVSRPISVHLTYNTAWIDNDKMLQFREDIYGRDQRLADALKVKPAASNQ